MFFFPNPPPVLPTLNGFSVHKKPTVQANVQEMVLGNELTFAFQAFPLWEFELTYEVLRTQTENWNASDEDLSGLTEFEQIAAVFAACRGQYGRFYYDDPTDNSRLGQFIANGDGFTTSFRVVRSWGGGNLELLEPVGGVNTNKSFVLYQNGIPQAPGAYGISVDKTMVNCLGGYIPPPGVTLTMDFYFFYLCRFLEDLADFEEFLSNRWGVKSFKFRSVKDGNWTPTLPGNFLLADDSVTILTSGAGSALTPG